MARTRPAASTAAARPERLPPGPCCGLQEDAEQLLQDLPRQGVPLVPALYNPLVRGLVLRSASVEPALAFINRMALTRDGASPDISSYNAFLEGVLAVLRDHPTHPLAAQ